MIFFIVSFLFFRENFDDTFIKKVNDNSFSSTIQHLKSGFLFFHHPGYLVSDTAYLRFIDVAKKYKEITHFMVITPRDGVTLSRNFQIDGFPTLFYIPNATGKIEMAGSFTFGNIESFISTYSNFSIPTFDAPDDSTVQSLLQLASEKFDGDNDAQYVFVLSDKKSKFGREADLLAREYLQKYKFLRIENNIDSLNVRFPSIIYIRKEDKELFVYKDDPQLSKMSRWLNSIPKSKVTKFDPSLLFSKDGSVVSSLIQFVHNTDEENVIQSLIKVSKKYSTLNLMYAYPNECAIYLSLFKQTEIPNYIYLESDFLTFKYIGLNDIDGIENFHNLQLEKVETPRAAYGFIASTTEQGFRALLNQGPVFASFIATNNKVAQDLENAVSNAAKKIAVANGKASWCLWDVTIKMPSFAKTINLGIPSLWFFPSSNYSQAVHFFPAPDYLDIIEWAYDNTKDFELTEVLERESFGNDQYDSI